MSERCDAGWTEQEHTEAIRRAERAEQQAAYYKEARRELLDKVERAEAETAKYANAFRQAFEVIDRVRELHNDDGQGTCYEDGQELPCRTLRSLEGGGSSIKVGDLVRPDFNPTGFGTVVEMHDEYDFPMATMQRADGSRWVALVERLYKVEGGES